MCREERTRAPRGGARALRACVHAHVVRGAVRARGRTCSSSGTGTSRVHTRAWRGAQRRGGCVCGAVHAWRCTCACEAVCVHTHTHRRACVRVKEGRGSCWKRVCDQKWCVLQRAVTASMCGCTGKKKRRAPGAGGIFVLFGNMSARASLCPHSSWPQGREFPCEPSEMSAAASRPQRSKLLGWNFCSLSISAHAPWLCSVISA